MSTMSNLDELERLLEAAPDQPPWIRPWNGLYLHAIGTDRVLDKQANLDLLVVAVNSLPALIAAARRAEALEKALDQLAQTYHGLADEPPHMFEASFMECSDIHCDRARATLAGEGAPR